MSELVATPPESAPFALNPVGETLLLPATAGPPENAPPELNPVAVSTWLADDAVPLLGVTFDVVGVAAEAAERMTAVTASAQPHTASGHVSRSTRRTPSRRFGRTNGLTPRLRPPAGLSFPAG